MRLLAQFSARALILLFAVALLGAASSIEGLREFTAAQKRFWSFQKIQRPDVPKIADTAHPVDAFIRQALEAKNLSPSPEADRVTLLRRVHLDLIGLPPTPEQVEAFLQNKSPDAYEKVVDGLLASPHFGEKWGRHWLDVVRYAESQGFKADETRPNAWRYRDYVIRSLNQDKPYDQFMKEQVAGDELAPNDPWAKVATAFARHYPDEYNARNIMQRRQEILNDITNVVGSAFLGLTVECAQCHDHKFDPIRQSEYFSLQSFFANSAADDQVVMLNAQQMRGYQKRLAEWEGKTRDIRDEMSTILAPKRKQIIDELYDKYPVEVQEALSMRPEDRSAYQWQLYHQSSMYLQPTTEEVAKKLKGEEKEKYLALEAKLKEFEALHPGSLPVGTGMKDLNTQAPPTYILGGGVYTNRQQAVEPAFLSVVTDQKPAITPLPTLNSTGRRTALASWLADPENPLPARVMVNRVWHHYFGRGFVENPNDFGLMGGRPSHPQLLDWLSSEFISQGWSMKKLHRLIVTSQTYRQASGYREDMAKADPNNKYLWRFPRQRLDAEIIRDSAIATAGVLNTKVGGPSVYPVLPDHMPEPRGGWDTPADPATDDYRRSVYIFVRRNTPYPLLKAFDFPDTTMSCGRRVPTITAPQALALLNDRVTLNWAENFASRVLSKAGLEASSQVEQAYRIAYSRSPDGWEKDTGLTFLEKQAGVIRARIEKGEPIAAPPSAPEGADPARLAALVDFCHALLNSSEFVYKN